MVIDKGSVELSEFTNFMGKNASRTNGLYKPVGETSFQIQRDLQQYSSPEGVKTTLEDTHIYSYINTHAHTHTYLAQTGMYEHYKSSYIPVWAI